MFVDKNLNQNLAKIRNQIVDYTLRFAAILGLIVYVFSLINSEGKGFQISFITDFIAVLSIVIIALYSGKINIRIKALIIIVALFFVIIIDLLQLGLLSANKVFIVVIPFFSLTVFSIRRTIMIFSIAVLAFVLIGILTITGNNPMLTELDHQIFNLNAWIINFLELIIVSLIILVVTYRFNQTYLSVYKELEEQNEIIVERERNYREIFNASTDAIFLHNMDGDILDVNDSMLKIYGYEKEDIPDITFEDLCSGIAPYDNTHAGIKIGKAISEGEQVFDWQARKKNGELFWVEVALKKTNIGGHDRVMAVIRDINDKKETAIQLEQFKNHLKDLVDERTKDLEKANEELQFTNENLSQQKEELLITLEKLKETQKQLIESEKMASIGILTAGVAHEINNPLNFVQAGLFGIDTYFQEHTDAKNFFKNKETILELKEGMSTGVKRITKIILGLNHFNRQSSSRNESCNVHEIIENCLVMLNNKIKHNIVVERNFTKEKFELIGNEGKLHQAFLNIIINAVHSIEKEGLIGFETVVKNESIQISIKDNGHGMSERTMKKMFDPFFTTKEVGEGTGLGLSIAYGIISEHNGSLEYKSEINKGTEAIITIPINKN